MISTTRTPPPGSVFSPTRVRGVQERFIAASMREDLPPCESVEAAFDGVVATVCDLGLGDDGRVRRECVILAGGVESDFEAVEIDGFARDGSSFGSRPVAAATIERIRRWAVGHGLRDHGGPARSA